MLEGKSPVCFIKVTQTFKTHTVKWAKYLPEIKACSAQASIRWASSPMKPYPCFKSWWLSLLNHFCGKLHNMALMGKKKQQPMADRRRSHCNIVAYLFSFNLLQKQQTATAFLRLASEICVWCLYSKKDLFKHIWGAVWQHGNITASDAVWVLLHTVCVSLLRPKCSTMCQNSYILRKTLVILIHV